MDDSLIIAREKVGLILTIQSDGEDLTDDDASAFAAAVLIERGERGKWEYDGVARLAYDKVNVFYVQ